MAPATGNGPSTATPKVLGEAVTAYLLEQRARGVSPHTLRAQKGDLGKLLAHAAGGAWPDWGVKPRTLRGFAMELGERGLDPASQARILSTVRSFFGWLFETQRIALDPATGLRNPKLPKRLPAELARAADDLRDRVRQVERSLRHDLVPASHMAVVRIGKRRR